MSGKTKYGIGVVIRDLAGYVSHYQSQSNCGGTSMPQINHFRC